MEDNILRGIKACYHEINGKNEFTVVPNTIIYLLSGKKHRFVVENSSTILGEKTTNPESTVANTKWAFILSWLWGEAKNTKEGEELPLWADLGGGKSDILELGIIQQYKAGKTIEITPDQNDIWLGNFHRMEVFTTRPNKGLFFHFVVIDKPKIYLAYFDKQNIKPEVKNFTINDGYYSYGQVIKFYVATHLLPMKIGEQYSEKYGKVDTETSFENLEFEITLTDENHTPLIEEPILKGMLVDYSPIIKDAEGSARVSTGTANIQYEFPVLIDSKWKDTIHTKNEKVKTYSVTIKITNTKTKQEYSFTPNMNQIRTIADDRRDFDDVDVSPTFMVKYESMDTILSQMEDKKSNMIQYIGDIDYNFRETNPCAYSKIIVNNGETDFEIFNEYALTGKNVKDRSENTIDVVCGDKATKDIKIIAKFLQSKDSKDEHIRTHKNGFKCQMILNDGKPHDGIRDVFKMEWIVGQWVPSKDYVLFTERYLKMTGLGSNATFFHPSNGKSSPKLEWNKPDQEAKGIESPNKNEYETVSVAGIQGLVENTSYTINEADDSITLKLKYNYNKSYNDKILNYLFGEQEYLTKGFFSDNFKNIWVVRYLLKWIKNEQISQTYFVPVTTCRYPNQVARVRVYPDMKWVVNFNYNIETPLYYETTTPLEEHYSGFNEGKINTSNNKERKEILDKKIANGLQHYVGRKTTFGLHVECEVSGEDDVLLLGKEFGEKYRKMLRPLFWMVNKLDGDLGVSDAKAEAAKISTGSAPKGLKARLAALPMSFTLTPPAIGVGVGIGYSTSQDGKITYELDGRLIADPIIGAEVKLDILALGSKFKPWGAVIDALDIVSWLANVFSSGKVEIEYELYFQLTAKINLVGTDSSKGDVKPAKLTYNFKDKKYNGNIALQGYLEGKIQMSVAFRIKLKAEKGKDLTQQRTEENDKKAFELGVEVTATSFVTLTIGKNFGKTDDWDADFYFSGVKLIIKVKAGFKGVDSELDLIPSLNKKINIFKEGEYD
ncbi:MAG: hypothetical protein ACK5MD_09435 [Flavobacteriales bacterium]